MMLSWSETDSIVDAWDLGHDSIGTTAICTHLPAISEAKTQAALANLYQPFQL